MHTETELMLRLQSGDDSALAGLYDALGPNVYALALQMLSNREDAEEVLQDTFGKLYQNVTRFDPELGSARAYIYTIARNEARMRLRAKRSRPSKAESYDLYDATSPFKAPNKVDHDLRISLGKALEHLHDDDAKLLKASFFEGYSHAELSEQTGLPLGTVKSRVRRALLKLREVLVDV